MKITFLILVLISSIILTESQYIGLLYFTETHNREYVGEIMESTQSLQVLEKTAAEMFYGEFIKQNPFAISNPRLWIETYVRLILDCWYVSSEMKRKHG